MWWVWVGEGPCEEEPGRVAPLTNRGGQRGCGSINASGTTLPAFRDAASGTSYDHERRWEGATGSAGRTESTSEVGTDTGCGLFLGLSSGPQA